MLRRSGDDGAQLPRADDRGSGDNRSATGVSFLILVGMSGAQEGPDVAEEEFATAFGSLRIEP